MLVLKNLDYREHVGNDREWSLSGLEFGALNLLVGKNATGKTRALTIISNIATRITGESNRLFAEGEIELIFTDGSHESKYIVHVHDHVITNEQFLVDGDLKLVRSESGEGKIYAEKVSKGEMIEFQTRQNQLAVVAKRDSKQHSFLEPLHVWANAVRHYHFGSSMGKTVLGFASKRSNFISHGAKDSEQIISVFNSGVRDFKDTFIPNIISDMAKVDYPITSIGTSEPLTFSFSELPIDDPIVLYVKEVGIKCKVDQLSMSQGMYRVLSILILINYVQCRRLPACVIIDDIGEGLDFDRSCLLVDLIRHKAMENTLQLLLSTNDRFVMNHVPLEEWCVLQRDKSKVTVRNYANSQSAFDEFMLTGLNNFDLLATDYLSTK